MMSDSRTSSGSSRRQCSMACHQGRSLDPLIGAAPRWGGVRLEPEYTPEAYAGLSDVYEHYRFPGPLRGRRKGVLDIPLRSNAGARPASRLNRAGRQAH